MKAAALLLALSTCAAHAQSLPEQLAPLPNISFKDWRNLTLGKTVVYEINGETFSYEIYNGGSSVTIQLENGSCIDGTWFMEQSAFCFEWIDGPLNCFNHKRLGEDIYVIGLENGVETTDIQKVARIDNIAVSCGPALLSSFPVNP